MSGEAGRGVSTCGVAAVESIFLLEGQSSGFSEGQVADKARDGLVGWCNTIQCEGGKVSICA